MDITKEELIKKAREAKLRSYSPYSSFCVGAALLCDDGSVRSMQTEGLSPTCLDLEHTQDIVRKALQKQFAPEFLNRLDNIIHFDQLDQDAVRKIVDIELTPLVKRIADIGYHLEIQSEARDLLGKKGYDIQYGARPIKRAIQDLLEDVLCEVLINTEVAAGAKLMAVAEGEKIEIKVTNE